jgi:hypothetical protein
MTDINSTINATGTIISSVQPATNMIDPFWFYSSVGVLVGFIVILLIFFLGETFKLRIMMLGRQRSGYGVIEIIHRNGRRTLHPKKFEREVTVGNFLFKPKYDQEHLFRNEYGMPTVQFNVRSIENIPIVNPEMQDKDSKGKKPIEVPENCQTKPNKPPMVLTDPAEDLQSHMAFYQMGLLKGGGLNEKLFLLLVIAVIMIVIFGGVNAYGMYKLGAFG